MSQLSSFLVYIVLLSPISSRFFQGVNSTVDPAPDIALAGSTPGDDIIKSLLTIPIDTKVDFIKWNLALFNNTSNQKAFDLRVVFGVSRPNTLGFVKEEQLNFQGTYSIQRNSDGKVYGEIYKLVCSKLPHGISIVKLNDNLFHILSPSHQLIKGNGGWSYTLNRKQPVNSTQLPVLTKSSSLLNDTSQQVIFEGRTPCLEIARENNLNVASDCFKLKWKLTLYRDPKTRLPSTYLLQSTFSREKDIVGKWSILKGIRTNPNVIVYQLDPDKPGKTISFLAGDDNILYFLDKDNRLFVGNSDFSYTLNKRGSE